MANFPLLAFVFFLTVATLTVESIPLETKGFQTRTIGSFKEEVNFDVKLKKSPSKRSETGEALPIEIINLDDLKDYLLNISCYLSFQLIKVNFTEEGIRAIESNLVPGAFIIGSSTWGCKDSEGYNSLFLRKIQEFTIKQESYGALVTFETIGASYLDLFESASVKVHLENSEPEEEQTYASEANETEDLDEIPQNNQVKRNKPFTITEPLHGSSYKTGDILTITWNTNRPANNQINLMVRISGIVMDTTVIDLNVPNSGKHELVIPSSWASSSNYYARIAYDCNWLGCSNEDSKRFSVNVPEKGAFISPRPGESFVANKDIINATWLFPPPAPSNIRISLWISRWLVPDTLVVPATVISYSEIGNRQFNLSSSADVSSYYYFYIEYNCGSFFCDNFRSDYFTVQKSDIPDGILIYSPGLMSSFSNGGNIPLKLSSDKVRQVKAYLMMDRIGPDFTLRTWNWQSSNGMNVRDLPLTGNLPSSNAYYIYMEYDCTLWVFCSTANSKNFKINYDDVFRISPVQTSYKVGDSMSVSWTSSLTSGDVYVGIYLKSFFLWDSAIWERKSDRSGQLNEILSDNHFNDQLGIHKYYVRFSYGCWFQNYLCNYEKSNDFTVSQGVFLGYNYNPATERAQGVVPILYQNCSTINCNSLPKNPACDFCGNGGKATFKLDCVDCYTFVNYRVIDFEFIVDFGNVRSILLRTKGKVKMNIDLLMIMEGKYSIKNNITLYRLPAPYSFSFTIPIVRIPIEIGIFLDIVADAMLSLTGRSQITAGADASLDLNIEAKYGSQWTNTGASGNASFSGINYHPLKVEAQVTANFEMGLKPVITAKVFQLVELSAGLRVFSRTEGFFQFPAFSAVQSGSWKSGSIANYGNCAVAHYLRYDFSLGLNAELKADVLGGWLGSPITITPTVIAPKSILSGCLMSKESNPIQVSFQITKTLSELGLDIATAKGLLIQDFLSAVSVNPFSLASIEWSENTIKVFIIDSDVTLAEDLANELINVVSDPTSTLYSSNSLITKFINPSTIDETIVISPTTSTSSSSTGSADLNSKEVSNASSTTPYVMNLLLLLLLTIQQLW